MIRIKTFESFSNFSFIEGKTYHYSDLPDQIKSDIDVQLENSEYNGEDYIYIAQLLNPSDTEEYIHNVFGEYNITDAIDHPDMQNLIDDIKRRGVEYPSVGIEGNHRALACYELGIPLPYLKMELIDSNDEMYEMYEDKYDYKNIIDYLKRTHGWGDGVLTYFDDFESNNEYFKNPENDIEYSAQFHVYLSDMQAGRLRGEFSKSSNNLRVGKWQMGVGVSAPTSIYNNNLRS